MGSCEPSRPRRARWSRVECRWSRWKPDVRPARVGLLTCLALLTWSGVGNPQAPKTPRKPSLPGTISARTPADLVVINTRIYTAGVPSHAEAMAVLNGRIVAIGSYSTVLPYIGSSTEVWDL